MAGRRAWSERPSRPREVDDRRSITWAPTTPVHRRREAASIRPSCSPGRWRAGSRRPVAALLDRSPGPPQTGLARGRAPRSGRASRPRRAAPAVVLARRRRRDHRRHARRRGRRAARRRRRGAWSRSPRPARRRRREPRESARAYTRPRAACAYRCEVPMEIVVRGKNRPVAARLEVARAGEGRAHRPLHPRRRPGRGRLLRAAATRASPIAAVRDHRPPEEALREGARGVDRAGGRARPRDRQGRAPGRAHQGAARREPRRTARARRRQRQRQRRRSTSTTPTRRRRRWATATPASSRRKRFATKPMDPEEAALQMDLLGHDFFLFTNTETGSAAVLYRRNDGHLGLIETSADRRRLTRAGAGPCTRCATRCRRGGTGCGTGASSSESSSWRSFRPHLAEVDGDPLHGRRDRRGARR